MANFPFTEVKQVARWTNYSGTIPEAEVPIYCTPDVEGDHGQAANTPQLARHGAALSAIVDYCLSTPNTTLRTIGSRWSFSSILGSSNVILDPANLNVMRKVAPEWLTSDYQSARGSRGFTPIFIQGGAHIGSINRRLLDMGLALQTSGAGDGHRMAGCIATGTHGAALGIGAVHDTLLAVHLITGADESVLIQPSTKPALSAEVAAWLATNTRIPTRLVTDDALFRAAQVGLGSLGIVHGVILETVPLYALRGLILAREFTDADVWRTIDDLDTRRLHPDIHEQPYHFEILFHPYPAKGCKGAFVKLYWKQSADGVPRQSPLPAKPDASSDTMGLISTLGGLITCPLATEALRLLIGQQLESRYKPGVTAPQVPGMIFGPTGLPPGHGASTEVVVHYQNAHRALEILYRILRTQADQGEHLFGAVAVRFVPATQAFLGMNVHDMNVYLELPSVRNQGVLNIYQLFWDALEHEHIPFTCHWGQLHGLNPARVQTYFGDRVEHWKTARNTLLNANARRVFGATILREVGLDS